MPSSLIKKTLLRSPNKEIERHTTWLEIFFDLIFAVVVTEISIRLYNNLTYIGALECLALFIPVMWTWTSYTVFAARFDNDDMLHWVMTFIIMFAASIMAVQTSSALEKGADGFAVGFLIAQISLLLLYSGAIFDPSTPRNMLQLYLTGFCLGALCWFVSLFFLPPSKFIFWVVGTLIYFVTPWIGRKKILSQIPLHPVYIPERFGSLTIIILGQTVTSVVFGLESANWHFPSVLASILAFVLAILLWAQYYRFTRRADYQCTLQSGQPFIYTHIPLILSLIMIGACAEDVIISPTLLHTKVHVVFCLAAIGWLASFYLLQYIATPTLQIRGLAYIFGALAIVLLIFFPFTYPLLTLTMVVIIFAIIFSIQCKIKHPSLL